MRVVTARELKNKTGKIVSQARAGEKILVTVRGKPAAAIVPPTILEEQIKSLRSQEEAWKDIKETLSKSPAPFDTYQEAMRWVRKRI